MLSQRFHWNPSPNRLSQRLAELRAAGDRILDLTISNPTAAGIPYDEDAIMAAFRDPAMLRHAPQPRGLAPAREAVSAYYAARGDVVPPEHIHLTASTSEAYSWLLKLLTDPGDEILVPRPSYPLIEFLAGMEVVSIAQYSLRYTQGWGWGIDFTSLEAALTSRTRAVLVINPNNPTGNHLRTDEARRLCAFCEENRLALICDEVFFDYPLDEADRISTAGLRCDAPVFTLNGFSKVLALPQMKLGWIVTTAPAPMLPSLLDALDTIADTYLSVGTPIQIAAPALFTGMAGIQAAITGRCLRNRGTLHHALAGRADARLLEAQGGWYAVLQMDDLDADEEFLVRLLDRHHVLLHSGWLYDFVQRGCLVVSLIAEEEAVAAAASTLPGAGDRW